MLALAWEPPVIALAFLWSTEPAPAQVISPGKLAAAHSELDGLRGCTLCHQLREHGVADRKCLSCHTPIRVRMERGTGYHASLHRKECVSCHREHSGRDFAIVSLDVETFDHDLTGYPLVGKHNEAECRECHRPEHVVALDVRRFKGEHGSLERTMLGLGRVCLTCHADDQPHENQFADRRCDDCHSEVTWEATDHFDHEETRYPLRGSHREVPCASCHAGQEDSPFQYRDLAFGECGACHEDPHQRSVSGTCDACHDPSTWTRVRAASVERSFDHSRTRFPLEGPHAEAECGACHDPRTPSRDGLQIRFIRSTLSHSYPRSGRNCTACHTNPHDGSFPGRPSGAECDGCHDEQAWLPTTYEPAWHDRETPFGLTGAHGTTPCTSCHENPELGQAELTFQFANTECAGCHRKDDPHPPAMAFRDCSPCHATDSFLVEDFAHGPDLMEGAEDGCRSCHGDDDPHHGQFGDVSCDSCHDTATFDVEAFDHGNTRFPLDGAHEAVDCASCHKEAMGSEGKPFVRYRLRETGCTDCHGARR